MSSGHHFNLHISHHGKETSHDSHPQPSSEFPVSDHPEDSVDETNDDSHLKESLDIDLPQSALDLSTTFDSILSETSHVEAPEVEKVQKRASNVMKLAQENEKLKEELRAMTERLENGIESLCIESTGLVTAVDDEEAGPESAHDRLFVSGCILFASPHTASASSSTMTTHRVSEMTSRRPSVLDSPNSPLSRRQSEMSSRRPSIDPSRLIPMDKFSLSNSLQAERGLASHIGGANDFNVVFVGAGNIMFGSDEGPWNHSFRFEHKLGPRLKVVALIDPAIERATSVLQKKCETFVRSAYEHTRVFRTLDDFVKNMSRKDTPRAVIVGSPPMFRGTLQPGRDIELQILKHFPGVALFIEKPAATGPASEIEEAFKVAKFISDSGAVCSVGYMLRYLKAVQMMKQIINENNLIVMATVARYACAYEAIAKPDWWDKSKRSARDPFLPRLQPTDICCSAGPIIEQGTHFCDLSRYFGGEVDISTVSAHSLEWDENAGYLSKIVVDETAILPENRVPRVTAATWKYENGAVGSFTHLVTLQGHDYSCELEVYADGYQLKLVNPYVQPVLYVRRPGSDHEEAFRFPDDDPFFSEISVLIDNIEDIEEDPETAQILCTFEDACRSYELTWAIRLASERSRKIRKEAGAA
ncbi:Uncharacterized protein UNK4.17 [Grifola frondosa]|uniref:Uncharacterized protein UNK4.17 n=1 Tax=Grifola frondosa TaxID=5627 RepID=A0A1C7MG93_GRIFR|nr:Uncharacterized protein UNK4.17 [Grifola frondosa]